MVSLLVSFRSSPAPKRILRFAATSLSLRRYGATPLGQQRFRSYNLVYLPLSQLSAWPLVRSYQRHSTSPFSLIWVIETTPRPQAQIDTPYRLSAVTNSSLCCKATRLEAVGSRCSLTGESAKFTYTRQRISTPSLVVSFSLPPMLGNYTSQSPLRNLAPHLLCVKGTSVLILHRPRSSLHSVCARAAPTLSPSLDHALSSSSTTALILACI